MRLAARAAAALAFGGDASARDLLKPWNDVTVDAAIENLENLNARCQAAVGLAALGDRAGLFSAPRPRESWLRLSRPSTP